MNVEIFRRTAGRDAGLLKAVPLNIVFAAADLDGVAVLLKAEHAVHHQNQHILAEGAVDMLLTGIKIPKRRKTKSWQAVHAEHAGSPPL